MNAETAKMLQEIEARFEKPAPEHEPYFIEVGDAGCTKCGHDRNWDIIDPDGIAGGTSYGNIAVASEICDMLNTAFVRGRQDSDIATLIKLVRQLAVENAVSLDRQYLAGAQQGYILGELGDREGHNSLVAGRMKEIHAALPAPPGKGE